MSCLHLETTSSPKPRRLQKPRRQLQCFFGVGRRFTEGLTGLVFPRSKPPCTFFAWCLLPSYQLYLVTASHFFISRLPPSIHQSIFASITPPSSEAWWLTDDHLRDYYPIGAPSRLLSPAVSYRSVASGGGTGWAGLQGGTSWGCRRLPLGFYTSLDRYCTMTAYLYFNKHWV